MTEPWRSRIVGHGEEAPEQLLANPRNWRIHPKAQQDALAGVLSEVGWVQNVIVNQRTGHVIDGHARIGGDHPAVFSVAFPEYCVPVWTQSGDIVLEPFSGSGTTLIACERLGRRCYAMEIEPRYVDVAVRRWEEFTGKKAVLEGAKPKRKAAKVG